MKKITVGVDFDGVLAYNPFRVVRAPVVFVKRHILGIRRAGFYIPKTDLEKFIWAIMHESSIFPAIGTSLLVDLVKSNRIEAHLVTARYSFLQDSLFNWLDRHKLRSIFSSVTINEKDGQPHLYKARVIEEKKFDYFIEDNLDIVTHLIQKEKGKRKKDVTKVLWIYNILDRFHPYPHKYPYLKKALESIVR